MKYNDQYTQIGSIFNVFFFFLLLPLSFKYDHNPHNCPRKLHKIGESELVTGCAAMIYAITR